MLKLYAQHLESDSVFRGMYASAESDITHLFWTFHVLKLHVSTSLSAFLYFMLTWISIKYLLLIWYNRMLALSRFIKAGTRSLFVAQENNIKTKMRGMCKSFVDLGVKTVPYWLVGFSFSFHGTWGIKIISALQIFRFPYELHDVILLFLTSLKFH